MHCGIKTRGRTAEKKFIYSSAGVKKGGGGEQQRNRNDNISGEVELNKINDISEIKEGINKVSNLKIFLS